ncbi:hypothetical protein O5630_02585, partial [Escherichia coli]|nr:hypothetical protein [Escherichia coli]
MARIGGTCYFKIDGQQLSLTGGIEVPMNRTVATIRHVPRRPVSWWV